MANTRNSTRDETSSSEVPLEEVPLIDENRASSSSDAASAKGVCRICLEDAPFGELEEPCSCSGTLQRAHHSCLQRWINEREVVEGREDPLVCEICKTKYKGEYTVPPRRPGRTERVQIGRDVFLIVVDPQSGLATARPLNGFEEYDPDGEDVADRLNPLAACAVSFVLFTLCSLLLSHLFASLPASFSPEGDTPEAMDEAADAQFQDISATLLLLWLMMRLLVLVAPMYALRRLLMNVRERRRRGASEIELDPLNSDVEQGQAASEETNQFLETETQTDGEASNRNPGDDASVM